MPAPSTCAVSGIIYGPGGLPLSGAAIKVYITTAFVDAYGNYIPAGIYANTTSASDGTWSLNVVQTASLNKTVTFRFEYPLNNTQSYHVEYPATIPNVSSAAFTSIVDVNSNSSLVAATSTTDLLPEGVVNLYFTQPRVLATPLTGFVAGSGTVSATDTVLQAIDKLAGNALSSVPSTRLINTTSPLAGGGDLSADRTISIPAATSSVNGYLKSTDWSTFNNKQNALTTGNLTDAGTDGINVTGGTGAIIGSGVTLAQHVADISHNGYLSSTDWSTFNAKQSALGYTPENVANKDTDGTLSANSDTRYASQKATKTYADTKVASSSVGIANGVASLDSGGKVPVAQLPATLMNYRGAWNASTNSPTLADGTGLNGDVYRASVAGTQNLGSGSQTWAVGDFAIYNGSIWQHSPAADGVSSVNGSTGAVTVNAINQLTGDVVAGPASGSQSVSSTISNGAVTNAKIANSTIDLTTKVTGLLPVANGGTGKSSLLILSRRYIDFANGNDSNDGSEFNPWKTLSNAYSTVTDASLAKPYVFYLSGGNNDTDSGTINAKPNISLFSEYPIQINAHFTISGGSTNDEVTFTNILFNASFTWTRNDTTVITVNFITCVLGGTVVIKQANTTGYAIVNAYDSVTNAFELLTHHGLSIFENHQFVGVTVFDDSINPALAFQASYVGSSLSFSGGGIAYFSGMAIDVPNGASLTGTSTANGTPVFQTDSGSVPPTISGSFVLRLTSNSQYEAYSPTTSANWNVAPTNVLQGLDYLAATGIDKSQTTNKVLASPNGSSGVPTFRALAAADIPSLPYSSNTLTSAHLFVGNGSNVATDVAASGDLTLANTGAFTVAKIQGTTVSGTTGTSNVVFSSAPTLTNPVVGTQSQGDSSVKAASTAYVDVAVANAVAGVNPAVAVQAATTAASDTSGFTYNNGVSGVGATFTGSANTAVVIDGYTFTALNQRLLVKNDTQSPSGAFNGIYTLTQLQTLGLPPILTRALDYDTPSDMNNTGAIPVINGTVNGTTSWVLTSLVSTVGTSPLTFTKFTRNPADYLLVANNLSDVASKNTSFNNLSPMTTGGDLIYGGASGSGTRLPNGSSGQVLSSAGGTSAPVWQALTVAQTTISTQAISSTAIDWSTGSVFTKTLSANTTFTFSNAISGQTIVVRLTNTASNYTVTWPTAKWSGGTAPTMTTGAKDDVYTFVYDGSTYYGSAVQNMS